MIEVKFGLTDPMNPQIGYDLEIRDARNGEGLFFGCEDPATGKPLLTANDCLRVASGFSPGTRAYDVCESLIEAYVLGEVRGGEVDWSWIDEAVAIARDVLPGLYEEIRKQALLDGEGDDYDDDEESLRPFPTGDEGASDVRVHCPACGSVEQRLLGALGNTVHLRCAACGLDHSVTPEA